MTTPPVDPRTAASQGHYTGHFKSVVTKPQNVLVARDIACAGYVAGGNCKFFANEPGTANYKKAAFVKNMQNRLGFNNDEGVPYASLMSFPLSAKHYNEGKMDTVMSISSRMLPWDTTSANSQFPGGPSYYDAVAGSLGLNSIHYGEDIRAAENMEYVSQGAVNNALCFVGPHRKYNPWAASHVELVPGQGHFGPDAVPGVSLHERSNPHPFALAPLSPVPSVVQDARWRRGEVVSLKAARDHMKTYESAAHAVMSFK